MARAHVHTHTPPVAAAFLPSLLSSPVPHWLHFTSGASRLPSRSPSHLTCGIHFTRYSRIRDVQSLTNPHDARLDCPRKFLQRFPLPTYVIQAHGGYEAHCESRSDACWFPTSVASPPLTEWEGGHRANLHVQPDTSTAPPTFSLLYLDLTFSANIQRSPCHPNPYYPL